MAISITLSDFYQRVRDFLQDKPELNRLIRQIENDDTLIELATEAAIDTYNHTPPPLKKRTFASFPDETMLRNGVIVQLLLSQGMLQSRNHLNYASGGISVSTFDKAQDYRAWMGMMQDMWEKSVVNTKVTENIAGAYGGFSSNFDYRKGS